MTSMALKVAAPLSEPPSLSKTRPRLLDLFCGAGGAAMGYHRAGFEVVGMDVSPQPHYPFEFIKADVMEFQWITPWRPGSVVHLEQFDAIHASPPCQRWTRFNDSQPGHKSPHLDLITPCRPLLEASGLPWVMENVPGSPLRGPVQVCGTAFGLGVERGQLWRHRWFEANFSILGTICAHDGRGAVMVTGHGKDGYRGSGLSASEAREGMQIGWMNRDEMAEAVPPAYTEWIGRQLLAVLERTREASA